MAQIKNETEKRQQTVDDNKKKKKKVKEKKNPTKPQIPTEFNPPERKLKGLTRLKLF